MTTWQLLEGEIKKKMEKAAIPGLAIAISQNDEVIYSGGFGKANLETGANVTPETIFGTASITKSFTALMIIKLEQAGKLSRDDAVKKYLPQFELAGYENIEAIKIHHLLSHTTGLPTLERKEELVTFDAHLAYLKSLAITPLGSPGEYFCYNNDLFLLLGAIIEDVTGEDYKKVIMKEIILPQNMTRTTFDLKTLINYDNVATPYVRENGQHKRCPWPTLGNYAVGGGIRSTVLDLLKYGQLYMQDKNVMYEPVHQTHGNRAYSYGLHITPNYNQMTLIEHGGSQPGVSSNFGFIPEKNLVVAVLTNVNQVDAADIWLDAVNVALGLPLSSKRSIEPYYLLKREDRAKFVGTYVTGEGAEITIQIDGGHLQAVIDGEVQKLRASNQETLVLLSTERPIRFYFNTEKKAWALFIGLRMFVRKES